MRRRFSNLCCYVIPVHELTKCVTEVLKRCLGLTAGRNGPTPTTHNDVAYLCGTLPPRAALPFAPICRHGHASPDAL
jgi:hypothetical protein